MINSNLVYKETMPEDPVKGNESSSAPVVLYDGVCRLCNGTVNFIVRRDRKGRLKMASLQSDFGRAVLAGRQIESDPMDSMWLLEGNRLTAKSTAMIRTTRYMDGGWPLCMIFLIIPRFFRDFIYDIIAKNRYRWFGKYDTCPVPDPELENRYTDP